MCRDFLLLICLWLWYYGDTTKMTERMFGMFLIRFEIQHSSFKKRFTELDKNDLHLHHVYMFERSRKKIQTRHDILGNVPENEMKVCSQLLHAEKYALKRLRIKLKRKPFLKVVFPCFWASHHALVTRLVLTILVLRSLKTLQKTIVKLISLWAILQVWISMDHAIKTMM